MTIGDSPARGASAFHSALALAVVSVGILGVLHDSRAQSHSASCMVLHALFGALLWISVVARFFRRLRQSPRMLPIDVREFSRGLSRLVYLVLYVLMFSSLVAGALSGAPRHANVGPAGDFQGYLGYGVLAIATIHALAAMYRGAVSETDG